MKLSLKYFYTSLLFIGMMCSCFQFAIIQLSKAKKETVSRLSMEEDTDDAPEEDSENLKKEIEDDYLINHFEYSFYEFQNTKTALCIHQLNKLNHPDLDIYTPPPKV